MNHTGRAVAGTLASITWLITSPFLHAQAEPPDSAQISELQALISKVVDLEEQAGKEKSDWQAQKAEMDALLRLYRQELVLLEEELAQAGVSAEGFDKEQRRLKAEVAALNKARTLAVQVVAEHRSRALALVERFPVPLQEDVAADRLTLENWSGKKESRAAIRALLGMINAAENFNRGVRRSTEERNGREVTVIYLGLARAFYTGLETAGIGVPGPSGWEWQEEKDIASEVRSAIAQLEKKSPPELLALPVEIKEPGSR